MPDWTRNRKRKRKKIIGTLYSIPEEFSNDTKNGRVFTDKDSSAFQKKNPAAPSALIAGKARSKQRLVKLVKLVVKLVHKARTQS